VDHQPILKGHKLLGAVLLSDRKTTPSQSRKFVNKKLHCSALVGRQTKNCTRSIEAKKFSKDFLKKKKQQMLKLG
jgi:hypothetical protein